eukprot:4648899-Pyramimonas_sp.AAC.1
MCEGARRLLPWLSGPRGLSRKLPPAASRRLGLGSGVTVARPAARFSSSLPKERGGGSFRDLALWGR